MLHGKIAEYGISLELITWLETTIPNKLPPSDCSIEDLRLLQGQQQVIELIKSTYEASSIVAEENVQDSITIKSDR